MSETLTPAKLKVNALIEILCDREGFKVWYEEDLKAAEREELYRELVEELENTCG